MSNYFLTYKNLRKNKKLILVFLAVALIWINNTSLFYKIPIDFKYKYLSHRGVHQTFDESKVNYDIDTSKIIDEIKHNYIENTFDSVDEAFKASAEIVELDIKATKDSKLAVFHDSTLEFRTDFIGEVAHYTMEELKKSNLGYGYSPDGGKSFPLRNLGISNMPELKEIFDLYTMKDKNLLIHVKDGNINTYKLLLTYLKELPKDRIKYVSVYGNNEGIKILDNNLENLRTMSYDKSKSGLIQYELIGYTGHIPETMKNTEIHIPIKYAKFLWGWPHKFMERMDSVNTRVVLVDGNGKLQEGFDSFEELKKCQRVLEGIFGQIRLKI